MPELPEAEVVAQQLRTHLLGAQLNDCWVGRADIVREGLPTLSWYRGAGLEGWSDTVRASHWGFTKRANSDMSSQSWA